MKSKTFAPPIFTILFMIFLSCDFINHKENMQLNIKVLNKEITNLAQKYILEIIDTYSIFLGSNQEPDPTYFTDDGIHLVKIGYENWIENAIQPFLLSHNYKTIAMVGNSITAVIESFDFGNKDINISNWQYMLKIKTYNLGVSGNTSYDIINRLESIASYDAECYLLLIGINDIQTGIQVWQTIENIEYIINFLSKRNLRIALQYVMPIS